MNLSEAMNRFYMRLNIYELRYLNKGNTANISMNSTLYLDLIYYTENCTVSYLAEALRVSKPAVTNKVGELMEKGLVQKRQSSKDKRVFYLTVSDWLAAEYEDYDQKFLVANKRIESSYSPEQIALFSEMLMAYSRTFEEDM